MSDKRAILNISERLLFEVSIVRHFIFLKITVKGVDFMNFIISGKNIEVTPGLKDSVINKLGKLERYFTPSNRNSSKKNLPSTAMTRFRSCAPRSLVSSQCSRKMLVYRWNFSDTISSYSLMQKQKKLMSCTRERTVHLV